jgi:Uncharacterised nucleotidyltransferase
VKLCYLSGVPQRSPVASSTIEEDLLCATLRGEPDVWQRLQAGAAERFLDAAARHRVRPLLAWALGNRGELPRWPSTIGEGLRSAERAEAAIEVIRRVELCRLLRAFEQARISVLVLKGAAFAYSLYPEPWLRPRQDTDLLIRRSDAGRADGVMQDAGYRAMAVVTGDLVGHQRNYIREAGRGFRHDCDLHWKPSNPVAIADVLPADDLWQAAEALSIAGHCTALIARPDHALLLACLHRASHHHDSSDLLWLYDLHLLAERLTAEQVHDFVEIGRRTGAGPLCARGLSLARDRFSTRLPGASLLSDLEQTSARTLPGVYGRSSVRKVDLLWADLRSIPDWRHRLRLLGEHLFPPADYMLKGAPAPGRPRLAFLYLWRIVRGARGWFRPL